MMTFANGELALSLNAADHCERKSLNIFFQRQADTYLFILYCFVTFFQCQAKMSLHDIYCYTLHHIPVQRHSMSNINTAALSSYCLPSIGA